MSVRCNPGWEELDASWLASLDMSGPTPGLFRVRRHGDERVSLQPVSVESLMGEIGAGLGELGQAWGATGDDIERAIIRHDRERLIDEARD